MNVWTGVPRPLEVSFPATIVTGPQEFPVTVRAAGRAVANAVVCLWLDTTVYAVDTTDGQGVARLAINPAHPGMMRVVVTGRNLRPFQGWAEVQVSGCPYVVYLKHLVNDAPPGGNGDGLVGPGETIVLPLWVRNLGDSLARSVWAVLQSEETVVGLTDSVKRFGTIFGRDSAFTGADGYRFWVAANASEGERLTFTLWARDTWGTIWPSTFAGTVAATQLRFAGFTVSDTSGNNNGRIDPNESAALIVTLRNDGSGHATNTSARLHSGNPRLLVTDSLGTFGTIPGWSSRTNEADRFTLSAGALVPETEVACPVRAGDRLHPDPAVYHHGGPARRA